MKALRLIPLLFLIFALSVSALPHAEEVEKEDTTEYFGDPECKICKGTGVVTPQSGRRGKKKAKQYVMYCYHKAAGKRCSVMIGGWEPCESCIDYKTMFPLIRDHEGICGQLEENASRFGAMEEAGFKLNYLEGVHFNMMTNLTHSSTHGVINAVEKAWDLFSLEWGLLPASYLKKQSFTGQEVEEEDEDGKYYEGYLWDSSSRNSQESIYLFKNKAEYLKFLDWYWDHGGGHRGMGGKALLKRCASFGVSGKLPAGRATYWRGETEVHCSLIHGAGHAFLRQNGGRKLPHWLDEGFAKYMEYRIKGVTLTHCIEYGGGTRRDNDWSQSSSWKEMLKKAAGVKESSFNDNTGKWVGLIPMKYQMAYNITNIPWQGMAQSWAFVSYLMGEGQKAQSKKKYIEKFKKLVSGISVTGVDPEDQEKVILEVYGISSDQLFAAWKKWLLRAF